MHPNREDLKLKMFRRQSLPSRYNNPRCHVSESLPYMSLYLTLSARRAASASYNSFSDPFIREIYATPILRGHLVKEHRSARLFPARNQE